MPALFLGLSVRRFARRREVRPKACEPKLAKLELRPQARGASPLTGGCFHWPGGKLARVASKRARQWEALPGWCIGIAGLYAARTRYRPDSLGMEHVHCQLGHESFAQRLSILVA
jgi:hypothetical protein